MSTAYVDVIATYNPLAFAVSVTKPRVCLDGDRVWTTTWTAPARIALPPGEHLVEVWVPWVTKSDAGRNGVQVVLAAGEGATVHWKVPLTVFQKGSISVVAGLTANALPIESVQQQAAPASTGPPPAWHPDPLGRFPMRWWDGWRWTDDVSDGGAASKDARGAS